MKTALLFIGMFSGILNPFFENNRQLVILENCMELQQKIPIHASDILTSNIIAAKQNINGNIKPEKLTLPEVFSQTSRDENMQVFKLSKYGLIPKRRKVRLNYKMIVFSTKKTFQITKQYPNTNNQAHKFNRRVRMS